MLTPIKTEKIYTIIIQQITDMIEANHLQPGDKLPSERELAQKLSVSRTSVRQALSAIAAQGIIRVKQGGGTFIAEHHDPTNTTKEAFVESLSASLASQQINPIEIAQARRLVESEVAGLCALNADSDICKELTEIISKAKAADENSHETFYELNNQLHTIIAKGSRNAVYYIFMQSFIQLMSGNLWFWGKEHSKDHRGIREKNWTEHEELVEAICRHESEKARLIMYNHLSTVVNEMTEVFMHP